MLKIRNKNKVKPFITKDGSEIREILHPSNSLIKSMSFAEATVYPGEITEYHFHKKSDEIYFIMTGQGILEIEGKKAKVKEGDCVLIPHGNKHRIKNTGKKPLKILCPSSPPYSHKDTKIIKK